MRLGGAWRIMLYTPGPNLDHLPRQAGVSMYRKYGLGVPAPVLAGLGELTSMIEELGRVGRTWRIWGTELGYCHMLLKVHLLDS